MYKNCKFTETTVGPAEPKASNHERIDQAVHSLCDVTDKLTTLKGRILNENEDVNMVDSERATPTLKSVLDETDKNIGSYRQHALDLIGQIEELLF